MEKPHRNRDLPQHIAASLLVTLENAAECNGNSGLGAKKFCSPSWSAGERRAITHTRSEWQIFWDVVTH